jgi:drug/metabolite transporter (DMT)-like permease
MKNNIHVATLLALSTALISGISVFVNKFAVTGMDPILFAWAKNALVAGFIIAIIIALKQHRELRTLTRPSWYKLGLVGLVGGALPFALFFTGLAMVPALTGALIHKTLFVWVALLAILFLRERFSALQWLGVGALFAANFTVGLPAFTGSLGEWLILAATLLWAIENVIAKKALAEVSALTLAGARMGIGSLLLLVYLVFTGGIAGLATLSLTALSWTLLTALFLTGYVLTWYSALKRAPASYVAALLVPATLVTNLLTAVFVTHSISDAQILATYLLTLGTVLVVHFAPDYTTSPVRATAS